MKHIFKFILWKLMSSEFWLLVLGSLAMYMGWQIRTNMRESIWKSYQGGPIKHNYKGYK
jgi:hypothetical protein